MPKQYSYRVGGPNTFGQHTGAQPRLTRRGREWQPEAVPIE